MKKLELENFSVQEMDAKEMEGLNGGIAIPKWVSGLGWGYLATQVIDHWDEIKHGFKEGYNATL